MVADGTPPFLGHCKFHLGDATSMSNICIGDLSDDHHYKTAVSELTDDCIVTLPLLTADDEFIFWRPSRRGTYSMSRGPPGVLYLAPVCYRISLSFIYLKGRRDNGKPK